jgi:urease accessory protein
MRFAMSFKFHRILPALAAALIAGPALAHTGVDSGTGFGTGFAHPFGGFDHLFAMVAVGLWATQYAARADSKISLWLLPAAFVLPMAAGFGLGFGGVAFPGVETGIALSVLVLGLAVAFALRPPLVAAMAVTALFALFHGHAHGNELPHPDMAAGYAAGMVLATALLHGLGVVGGQLARRINLPMLTRAAGAAVALAGVVILVG